MKRVSGKVGAIIVAAGNSNRMGGVDKIFALIDGEPLLVRVVDAFQSCTSVDEIIIVLSRKNVERGRQLVREHSWAKVHAVCHGGLKRQDSVKEGLRRLVNCNWVIIHDGARPCINDDLIERGLSAAQQSGAAVAAVPVKDTIKIVTRRGFVQQTPARQSLWIAQTPQIFRYDLIMEAYQQTDEKVTDDATLVERLGQKVEVYMGSYRNIKVTTPDDLAVAELFLGNYDRAFYDSGGACASVSATTPIG